MEPITLGDLAISLVAVAFGAWAGVVAWLGSGIRSDIKSIAGELHSQSERLQKYIIQTETRLAVLEDRVNHKRDKP